MELPQTLPAQLYLLAYDLERRRFAFGRGDRWTEPWLFSLAMRAAMLTDLYLTGHVKDQDGKACLSGVANPTDPVLTDVLTGISGQEWEALIAHRGHQACQVVREQLEATGWVHVRPRRIFGVFPVGGVGLYDEGMVSGLTDRVTDALWSMIDGRDAEPRPLALGLIAVQAQMPVVAMYTDDRRYREELREMTFAAIEPILALHQVVQRGYTDRRSNGGCGGGSGCGGGG